MLWNGHRAFAYLSCVGILPNFDQFRQILINYSVYPDKHDVWHKCHEKYKKSVYIDEWCPPPPPVHHDKLWSKHAVEYYLLLSRKDWGSGETVNAAKHFAIFTHFLADAILEPYAVWLLPTDKEWDYHQTADPLSNAMAELLEKYEKGEYDPPKPDNWRPCLHCFKLLPEDWAVDLAYSLRAEIQRHRYSLSGETVQQILTKLVSGGRAACRAVVHGWFTKQEYERLKRISILIPTLWMELERRKVWLKTH